MLIARLCFDSVISAIKKIAHILALVGSAILALFTGVIFFYELFLHKAEIPAFLAASLAFCLAFSGMTWLIWNVGKFKIALKIIVILIAIPVSLLGMLIGVYSGYELYQEATLPEICKNFTYHQSLQVRTQYIQDEFSNRINKIYPVPITEEDLKKSLVKQGFHLPDHPNPTSLPRVWAYAEYNSIPCDQSWVIEWTTQGDGIAHDIHGRYNSSCL